MGDASSSSCRGGGANCTNYYEGLEFLLACKNRLILVEIEALKKILSLEKILQEEFYLRFLNCVRNWVKAIQLDFWFCTGDKYLPCSLDLA